MSEPAEAGETDPDRPEARTYWTEVPRFLDAAPRPKRGDDADDRDDPSAAPDDDAVPPDGSWRGDGGQYLSPERNADAYELAAQAREREEAVSGDLRRVVEPYLESGGHLVGLEHRCKGTDRLKEKTAEDLADRPDRSVSEVFLEIPDAIRYTFQFSKETYVRGYYEVAGRMKDLGYEQVKVKNSWDDPDYKGINTRWVTGDGQLFEVQFHTEESFHAKEEVTHTAYERLRNPLASKKEIEGLTAFQREVSSWVGQRPFASTAGCEGCKGTLPSAASTQPVRLGLARKERASAGLLGKASARSGYPSPQRQPSGSRHG